MTVTTAKKWTKVKNTHAGRAKLLLLPNKYANVGCSRCPCHCHCLSSLMGPTGLQALKSHAPTICRSMTEVEGSTQFFHCPFACYQTKQLVSHYSSFFLKCNLELNECRNTEPYRSGTFILSTLKVNITFYTFFKHIETKQS